MQQVKIFKGVETEVAVLENEMNAWIRMSEARVLSMTGNISPQTCSEQASGPSLGNGPYAPADVLIVVLYETES